MSDSSNETRAASARDRSAHREPVADLEREDVPARRPERVPPLPGPDVLAAPVRGAAVRLPHEEQRAAAAPLPPQHQVAPERQAVEIGPANGPPVSVRIP